MNASQEQIIEKLIREHGREKVLSHAGELLTHAKWSDWQRLNSWINNTANKTERQSKV